MGISIAQLRNLDTTRLQDAADAAVIVGKNLADHAGAIVDAAGQSSAMWIGADADAQNALLQTFPPPLDAASTAFKSSAGTIDTLIGELDRAKADLETAIASHPEFTVGPDGGFTYPAGMETRAQSLIEAMNAACAAADTADADAVSALAKHDTGLGQGRETLNTGNGDDTVKIRTDPNGDIVATVNGKEHRYAPGTNLTVNTEGGNDNIDIAERIDHNADITVNAGAGEDKIQGSAAADKIDGGTEADEIYGGYGNDTIHGGDGDDYIDGQDDDDTITGGVGRDTIYGLDGNDTLSGNDNEDYLEGGTGDDTLDGGGGRDVLSGGLDNDKLHGGDDDDALYAGRGTDELDGGTGADKNFVQAEDTVTPDPMDTVQQVEVKDTSFINVDDGELDEHFEDRIRADLELYGSSPSGHVMIDELRKQFDGGDSILIEDTDGGPKTTTSAGATGDNSVVRMDPSHQFREGSLSEARPATTLYHELSHSFDHLSGPVNEDAYSDDQEPDSERDEYGYLDGVENNERSATGLPIDHDGKPSTDPVPDPDQPYALTENGLREEMGIPRRDYYGEPVQPDYWQWGELFNWGGGAR